MTCAVCTAAYIFVEGHMLCTHADTTYAPEQKPSLADFCQNVHPTQAYHKRISSQIFAKCSMNLS